MKFLPLLILVGLYCVSASADVCSVNATKAIQALIKINGADIKNLVVKQTKIDGNQEIFEGTDSRNPSVAYFTVTAVWGAAEGDCHVEEIDYNPEP